MVVPELWFCGIYDVSLYAVLHLGIQSTQYHLKKDPN